MKRKEEKIGVKKEKGMAIGGLRKWKRCVCMEWTCVGAWSNVLEQYNEEGDSARQMITA